MTQIRQTPTKELLKTAFSQLIMEEKFEAISVSQLCRKAGVSRGTFYLHYEDKYDMGRKLKEEVFAHLHTIFDSDLDAQESISLNLHYLQDNVDFIYAVYQSDFIDFRETVRSFTLQAIQQNREQTIHFLKSNFQLPEKYAQEVFLASMESILTLWIATGAKEKPEDIASMMLKTFDFSAFIIENQPQNEQDRI